MGSCVVGDSATIAGWGATSENGPSSATLLKLTVPVLSNAECNAPSAYDGAISDNMICAGYLNQSGKDSCQGDSGGPLVVTKSGKKILVGVASWGQG